MSEHIQNIWQRAHRYHYEDGMVEIGMGVLFVVIGLGEMVVEFAMNQGKPLWIILVSLSMVVLIMGGTVLMNKIVSRLKNTLTYPRTGYVELRQESKRGSAVLLVFSVALATSMLFSATIEGAWLNHMGFVIGIFMAAIIAHLGYRTYSPRFYFVAIIPFLAAFVLAILRLPSVLSSAIVFGLLGMGLLFSGIFTMNRFIEQNPVPMDEEA